MSAIIEYNSFESRHVERNKDRLIFTFFSLGIHATNSDDLQKRGGRRKTLLFLIERRTLVGFN